MEHGETTSSMINPLLMDDAPNPDFDLQPLLDSDKKIWAVGGGKGGVGKSLVTANIAITLARFGYKVVAIDLDLGGANLHTCLGVDVPLYTLSDFFSKRISDIESVKVPTPIKNLELISGAQDAVGVANLKHTQKTKLIQKLKEISADFLIFDLGAGTAYNTLDFFLSATKGVLTLIPEPTSIENTYRFIKSAYYRRLKAIENLFEIRSLIDMAMDQKNSLGIKTPNDLIKEILRINPDAGFRLKEEIQKFRPKLVVNQVRTQADIDIGFSIKSVCKKYFGIDMDYVGYLEYDSAVWQSVRRRKPLVMEFPNSTLVTHFEKIAQRLLQDKLGTAPRVERY